MASEGRSRDGAATESRIVQLLIFHSFRIDDRQSVPLGELSMRPTTRLISQSRRMELFNKSECLSLKKQSRARSRRVPFVSGQKREKLASFILTRDEMLIALSARTRNTLSIIIQNARVRVVRIVSPVKRDYRVAGRGGDPGGVAEGILKLSNRISG